MGKFLMFTGAMARFQIWLVVIAVINAIISIYYYFKVIIAMYFRTAEHDELIVPGYYQFVLGISALATLIIGIFPALISNRI
jgi:NADH-quinone oxidoreductase subunit N